MNHLQKLLQPDFIDYRYKIYLFTENIDRDIMGSTTVNSDQYNDFFNKIKNSNILNFVEENFEKTSYLNYETMQNNYYIINHVYHTKIKDMIIQIDNYKLIRDNSSITELNNILKSDSTEVMDNMEKTKITQKIFHDKINNFKVIFENDKEIYITFTLNEKNVKVISDLLNKISKIIK